MKCTKLFSLLYVRVTLRGIFVFFLLSAFTRSAIAFDLSNFGYTGEPLVEDAIVVFSPDSDVSAVGEQVRVAFYNIEMFTDGIRDGRNRTEEAATNQAFGAARIIEKINPDILFVSEIENERVLTFLNDAMAEPFPYGYIVLFGSGSGQIEKMNIAMLSRIKPISSQEVDFGPIIGPGRPTRGFFRAIFDLGDNHYLLVYALHLKANWGDRNRNYAQRANSMALLQDDVEAKFKAYPDRNWEVMVVGDFNTDPLLQEHSQDPTLRILQGWSDIWMEHEDVENLYTVATRLGEARREFPPALFDRMLIHPGLREKPWDASLPSVLKTGTVTDDISVLPGHGDHVSDHFPIYIDIRR